MKTLVLSANLWCSLLHSSFSEWSQAHPKGSNFPLQRTIHTLSPPSCRSIDYGLLEVPQLKHGPQFHWRWTLTNELMNLDPMGSYQSRNLNEDDSGHSGPRGTPSVRSHPQLEPPEADHTWLLTVQVEVFEIGPRLSCTGLTRQLWHRTLAYSYR